MVITFTEREKANAISLFPDEENIISVKLKIYKIMDFVIETARDIAHAIWILWNELYNQIQPIIINIAEKVRDFFKIADLENTEVHCDFEKREYKFVKTIGTAREGYANYRPIHRARNHC